MGNRCLKEDNGQLHACWQSSIGPVQSLCLDVPTAWVLSVPDRTGWLVAFTSVSDLMAQLKCLTLTEEGELLMLEEVKLRGRCVLLRRQILTQAEGEQMQLTVSLICIWCADSSSVIHWMYHLLVAGVLLRLWSLYVFGHVILTAPGTGAQVHVIAPVCAGWLLLKSYRLLLQCSSKM